MKSRLLAIAATAITSLALAGNAQALLVAGWDHSQYLGDGLLSIDGASYTDTLAANYSHLDPNGLGAESAAYGTLYLNGQFGSTNVGAGSGAEPVLPSAVFGSLSSNLTAPVSVPDGFLNPFDAFTLLAAEGQTFQNPLGMTALGAASVVYLADAGLPGTDWVLTFGGRTQQGVADVTVEFSADGANYAPLQTFVFTVTDTPYSLNLAPLADQAFVRFVFGSEGSAPVIDNVAIGVGTLVPEPGTALLLLTGLAGLTAHGRRRA